MSYSISSMIWMILCLILYGCGSQNVHNTHTQARGNYLRDAEQCWSRNPQIEAIATSSLASPPEQLYLKCLNDLGYQQNAKTDPLLVAIRKCQSAGSQVFSASGEAYQSAATFATIEKCLVTRGFTKPQIITSRLPSDLGGPGKGSSDSGVYIDPKNRNETQTIVIPPR